MAKSLYDILGVDASADEDAIKKAYRDLAKQYHPDHQRGKTSEEVAIASERFKEISQAYETLYDKEKRLTYDWENNIRVRPPKQSPPRKPGEKFDPYTIGKGTSNFIRELCEIADELFTGKSTQPKASGLPDFLDKNGQKVYLKKPISVSLEDVVQGSRKKVHFVVYNPKSKGYTLSEKSHTYIPLKPGERPKELRIPGGVVNQGDLWVKFTYEPDK